MSVNIQPFDMNANEFGTAHNNEMRNHFPQAVGLIVRHLQVQIVILSKSAHFPKKLLIEESH